MLAEDGICVDGIDGIGPDVRVRDEAVDEDHRDAFGVVVVEPVDLAGVEGGFRFEKAAETEFVEGAIAHAEGDGRRVIPCEGELA